MFPLQVFQNRDGHIEYALLNLSKNTWSRKATVSRLKHLSISFLAVALAPLPFWIYKLTFWVPTNASAKRHISEVLQAAAERFSPFSGYSLSAASHGAYSFNILKISPHIVHTRPPFNVYDPASSLHEHGYFGVLHLCVTSFRLILGIAVQNQDFCYMPLQKIATRASIYQKILGTFSLAPLLLLLAADRFHTAQVFHSYWNFLRRLRGKTRTGLQRKNSVWVACFQKLGHLLPLSSIRTRVQSPSLCGPSKLSNYANFILVDLNHIVGGPIVSYFKNNELMMRKREEEKEKKKGWWIRRRRRRRMKRY